MPNKKTAAQRQPYVDAMKGFGILCVVIGHFIEYHRGTAPGINALFTCIYLFHMAIFCTASGLVAKFSLRKLVTQQLWLYLISQAGITAFRAAALKDNIVDQGGWLQMYCCHGGTCGICTPSCSGCSPCLCCAPSSGAACWPAP